MKGGGAMPAGIWIRLKAFLFDYIWLLSYLLLILVFTTFIAPGIQHLFSGSLVIAQLTGFLLVTLPISLYFAICDSKRFKGTYGKQKMNLQVVSRSGEGIRFRRSLLRVAIKFMPWELSHFLVYRLVAIGDGQVPVYLMVIGGIVYGLMIAYMLTAALSKEKRTLYDRLSGTKVVKIG